MTAFRGTPGPWTVRIEDGDEWWFGGEDDKQAVVLADGANIVVGCGNTAEEIANTWLIAGAPDLLEALILNNYNDPDDPRGLCWCSRQWESTGAGHSPPCLMARAAIAAALGEDGAS